MNKLTQIAFIIALIPSCGDSATETTVVTTVITTAGTDTADSWPSTNTDESTTDIVEPTSTSTTSGDDTSTTTTTMGHASTTPGEPPDYCIENDDGVTGRPVSCTPTEASWCAEVAAFAGEYLPAVYAEIAVANCEGGGTKDPCSVCFFIANTCTQVAGPCDFDHMMYECGCLAQSHGVL